jgi:hypothetical protein
MIKAIKPNKSDYREEWFAEVLSQTLGRKSENAKALLDND